MACLIVAVVAVTVAGVLAGIRPAVPGPRQPGQGNRGLAPPLLLYPGAVVATIPVSGVISVTADAHQAWVVRAIGPPSFDVTRYQLVGIDLRTDKITLRVSLGRQSGAVAAGAGALWLTTPDGRARGQLERIDPATGRVVARLHLPAGECGSLTYGAGYFVANCQNLRPRDSEFFRIDAATGRMDWRSGTVTAGIGAVAVGPRAVWYAANFSQVKGFVIVGGRTRAVSAPAPGYELSYTGNQSLAYGDGSFWELSASERVLRIDPVSGQVIRVYRSRGYDPAQAGGLDFLTIGSGSLWFLDDGYPFSGVLRVSMATGRSLGGVIVPPGSCGQQACTQIYATPGSIWVPTMAYLLRLDPARMTEGLHPEPGHGSEGPGP